MKKTAIARATESTAAANVQHDAVHTGVKGFSRRDILNKSAGGVIAATAFGAVPLRGWAAEPVNIGALYPVTGSMAQIGQGCVNAAKLAVQMVNDAGGIKSLGGAKLNLVISDIQSDTTVTRTETDRVINGSKVPAIHGCYASALTLIASEVAERTRQSAADHRLEFRSAQCQSSLHVHALCARLAIRASAVANGAIGQ